MSKENFVTGCAATTNDDYQLNTISFIRGAARTYPMVEVVSRRIDGSIFRYNYAAAYKRIQQLANALVKLGIKPGDRVAVVEWNSHRYWELYQAISGIGAVLLQVNLRVSPDEKIFVINHSAPTFLFVADTLLPMIESIAVRLETVKGYCIITDKGLAEVSTTLQSVCGYEELLASEEPHYDWPVINEKSAYSACYTSGTTGRPKGVFYSHRAIYLHTTMMALTMSMSNRDVLMQTVPMFHANGWGLFFAACMVGGKLVFPGMYTAENIEVLIDLMISEKVTINEGAPAIFLPMLEYLRSLPEQPYFDNLRMVCGATEPPLAMMKGFAEYGAEIIHAYGATETGPLATCNISKPSLGELSAEERWEQKKQQGLPLNGLDLKIVDGDGNEIAPGSGESGEILIRGPWITRSYYDNPEASGNFTENGYWRSGDAGSVDTAGYLKLTDRFKDIIKSGGEWISSIDWENALMAHPAVAEAAVVGIEHPKWQERPLALVKLRPGCGEVSREEILEMVGRQFAKWQWPDEMLFVEDIPKTSVGKFSKKEIRADYKDFYLSKGEN